MTNILQYWPIIAAGIALVVWMVVQTKKKSTTSTSAAPVATSTPPVVSPPAAVAASTAPPASTPVQEPKPAHGIVEPAVTFTPTPVATTSTPTATETASDAFYAAAVATKAAQQQNEQYNGPVPVGSLQLADWKFLWWATINPATPKMHNWEYVVLSGSRAEIQQGLAQIGNDLARMRNFDATKYQGVLRAPYDAAVKQ